MKNHYDKYFECHDYKTAIHLSFRSAKRKLDRKIFGEQTWAYKFYINSDGEKNFGGKYYWFNHFQIYWAYRWYLMERIDKKGYLNPTVAPAEALKMPKLHSTLAKRYESI